MTDEETDVKPCPFCKREIAVQNLQVHELHCQKHLTVCKKCGEAIPKNGVEEHEAEYHKEVECTLCHKMIASGEIEDHMENHCSHRPLLCEFCDLECPMNEFDEHSETCGSRTDNCDVCLSPVMLKEMARHKASRCTRHTTLGKKQAPVSGIRDQLPYLQTPATSVVSAGKASGTPSHHTSQVEDRETVNQKMNDWTNQRMSKFREHRGPTPPQTQLNKDGRYRSSSGKKSNDEAKSYSEDEPDIEDIPCEFCSEAFAPALLENHQASCTRNPYNERAGRRRFAALIYFPKASAVRGEADEVADQSEEAPVLLDDDEVELPCQYCEKLCKPSQLRYHEVRCPKYVDEYYGSTGQTTTAGYPSSTSALQVLARTFNTALSNRCQHTHPSYHQNVTSRYYNNSNSSQYGDNNTYYSNNYDYNQGSYNDDYHYSNDVNSPDYDDIQSYPVYPPQPATAVDPLVDPAVDPVKDPVVDEVKQELLLPCEFCEEMFPHNELYQHQAQCTLNMVRAITPYPTDEELRGKDSYQQVPAHTTSFPQHKVASSPEPEPETKENDEPTSFYKGNRRFQAPEKPHKKSPTFTSSVLGKSYVGHDQAGRTRSLPPVKGSADTGVHGKQRNSSSYHYHHPTCPHFNNPKYSHADRQQAGSYTSNSVPAGSGAHHALGSRAHQANKKKSSTNFQSPTGRAHHTFSSPDTNDSSPTSTNNPGQQQRNRGIDAPVRQGRSNNPSSYKKHY